MPRTSRRQVRFSGDVLKGLRYSRFLTQEEAAAATGVTLRAWQRWERSQSEPYFRNLRQVADFFGVDPREFYPDDEVAA